MPDCYLLCAAASSSLDQSSHNISLFNLVEQINVRPDRPWPPAQRLPLEIHCSFFMKPEELGKIVHLRLVLVGPEGLESGSDTIRQRVNSVRFRARIMGLPMPPSLGAHELRADFAVSDPESAEDESLLHWRRDPLRWPLTLMEAATERPTTH